MPPKPTWTRPDGPRLEDAAVARLQRDVAQERLHVRGIAKFHVDPNVTRRELSDEERALRLPSRGGRRWKGVAAFDERVETIQRKQETLRVEAAMLRAGLATAEQADTERLAGWLDSGGRGDRPEPEVARIEQELERIDQDIRALDRLVDEALDQKVSHVDKHRRKLTREAAAEVERAHRRYTDAQHVLEQARTDLLEARRTQRWAEYYPDGQATTDTIRPPMLAGGLLNPVRRTLGITTQLAFDAILAALEADANTLRDRIRNPDKDGGLDIRDDAIWEQTPEGSEALNREKQRIREGLAPKAVRGAAWLDN